MFKLMIFKLLNEKKNIIIRNSIAKLINIGLKVFHISLQFGLIVIEMLNNGEIARITFKKMRSKEPIEYFAAVFIRNF